MEAKFRVVFTGRIQDGLDPARVKQEAATRLKASPAQLDQLFSLPRVILKKSVDADYGQAYVQALHEIGMLVELEPLPEDASGSTGRAAETPPVPDSAPPPARPMPKALSSPNVPALEEGKGLAPEENVIIPDIPAPVHVSADLPDPMADDLASSLAPLEAAYPGTAGPASSIISSYERMQANLSRAEALLNASHRLEVSPPATAETLPAKDSPPPHPASEPRGASQTGEPAMPPAGQPAPQQEVSTPQIAQAPLLFRTTIECTTCGTPHIIEGRLLVSILPSGEVMASVVPA